MWASVTYLFLPLDYACIKQLTSHSNTSNQTRLCRSLGMKRKVHARRKRRMTAPAKSELHFNPIGDLHPPSGQSMKKEGDIILCFTVVILALLRRVDCQCRPIAEPPTFPDLFPNPLVLTATTGIFRTLWLCRTMYYRARLKGGPFPRFC